MPITVTCTGCGKRLKAKESMAGRKVACPGCGHVLVVGSSDEDAAAFLLGDESTSTSEAASSSESRPRAELSPAETPAHTVPSRKPLVFEKPKTAASDLAKLPPLTTNDPPFWLRHLHWLLVLSLIPLAVSLAQPKEEKDFIQRLNETIDAAPPDVQRNADQVLLRLGEGKGSLEDIFLALPEHRLRGALLPRDSWAHWLFTLGAVLLFLVFLLALSTDGSASAREILPIGLFTATIGILFLVIVQWLAMWSQGMIIIPRSIVGILFYIVKFIGYSYRAALDPDNGFVLSFMGFTLGVGLCEEICKALPLFWHYRRPNEQTWRGAYLWGLASGAGFGLAESITYASDFYNGVQGAGIYVVRNISCVALHALWTGSAAIMIHQKQHLLQADMAWHDLVARSIFLVSVPMVLHGLYDTLLKKEMNALALGVAALSFLYLAFLISRLRGGDDQAAKEQMLREYQRRRKAMA